MKTTDHSFNFLSGIFFIRFAIVHCSELKSRNINTCNTKIEILKNK